MTLPEDIRATSDRGSNEEAWRPADFPAVLERATLHKLACVGGQFQFRGPIGTAEMHWLNAESTPRRQAESWNNYVARANVEVLNMFTGLLRQTNFQEEARQWKHINEAIERGVISDPTDHLYFVAYFDRDPDGVESVLIKRGTTGAVGAP